MGEVRTEFTSDITRLEKAYDELDKRNRKLAEQMQALKDKSKEASGTQEKGLSAGIGKLAQMAAGYVSISAAINLVIATEKERQELQAKGLTAQMSAADAQAAALRNLGNVSSKEQTAFINQINSISGSTGASVKDLYLGAGKALAAKGKYSDTEALAALEMSFRTVKEGGEEASILAGSLMDVAKATGTADPARNLGVMLGMGSQSHVDEIGMIAKNLTGPLAALSKMGDDVNFSAAYLSMLTHASTDLTGASTGTNAISLATQLEEFLPKEDTFTEKGKLSRKGTGFDSTEERIKYLQQNEKARQQFLATASFEKQFIIPFRDLLAGGENASLLTKFQSELPSAEEASAQAMQYVEQLGATDLQQQAMGVRRRSSSRERRRLNDIAGGFESDIRQNMHEDLADIGVEGLDQMAFWARYNIGTALGQSPVDAWESILRTQESNLAHNLDDRKKPEQLEVLRELLAETKRMREDRKQDKHHRLPATETHTE